MILNLTQIQPGESAIVSEIQGGYGLVKKLQNMGIRPGKKITKVSSHFGHGPQTVKVGNMQIAIGYGMAKKIFIEIRQ
ncbi:MAG: FeoA family protein [Candidatus Omnitrophota bacterium]